MTANQHTLTELLRQRHLIDHIQDEQTRRLAARWASTWDAIESELRTATLALAQLDDDQKATAAIRTIKARDALAIATDGLTDCLAASNHAAAATARHLIEQAASDQDALIATQLPPGHTVNLASVDASQIDAITRRTLQQITVRHWYLNAAATDAMKHALTVGVTLGRNPKQVAARMVRAVQGNFEGGLARALVIARTEQLDAYRAAAQAHHAANRDILQGWQWYAELDHRTCASCISHHGETHPLDEPGPLDHHQGRCTRLPSSGSTTSTSPTRQSMRGMDTPGSNHNQKPHSATSSAPNDSKPGPTAATHPTTGPPSNATGHPTSTGSCAKTGATPGTSDQSTTTRRKDIRDG